MALNLEIQDNKFRVITQEFQTNWLPDPLDNRKITVIFLRNLQNKTGKALFTLQELSAISESENRQAASQHLEEFRECGEDFYETLKRRRKVDEEVTKAVLDILKEVPLKKIEEMPSE